MIHQYGLKHKNPDSPFDDAGHRMVVTHVTKNRVRYRYYISEPHLRGPSKSPLGSISRVPASDIEGTIIKALTDHFDDPSQPRQPQVQIDRGMILAHIARIDVRNNQLAILIKSPGTQEPTEVDHETEHDAESLIKHRSDSLLLIPWCKPPSKKSRAILLPATASVHHMRPIRAERRADLIRSIARGRAWLDEIIAGTTKDVAKIAMRENCSVRHVSRTISMAFLAPALVKAAIEGSLPRGVGIANLRDAPAEWSRQLERLGLAAQPA